VFNPPRDTVDESIKVPAHSGAQKVVVIATNRDGKERLEPIDVVSPTPPPKVPTLHVVAIGARGPFRDRRFPQIPHAEKDAQALREFLEKPGVKPGDKPRYESVDAPPALVRDLATEETVRETFLDLAEEITDPNDALFVVLESHMLAGSKERFVISADTAERPEARDTPTADEILDALAKVAARGCKVMLILDTAHKGSPAECHAGLGLTDFVRAATRRNIITFVAANDGVSLTARSGHGAFAQAILDVFSARATSRPLVDPKGPMTLDDFQDAVKNQVLNLTSRTQFAACHIPETLSSGIMIFEPNRPPDRIP